MQIVDFESSYWHFQQIVLVEDSKFLSQEERVGTKEMGIFSSRLNNEGTYDPSWFTLWLATHSKTTYVTQEHPSKYQGNKPILVVCTGKYLSEALILASTNPQYDKRLFIEFPEKIQVHNMFCTNIVLNFKAKTKTIFVHNIL